MSYIKIKQVKNKFREMDRQVTKDGLHAIDVKIDDLIDRVCSAFNGHKRRINADIINLFKV